MPSGSHGGGGGSHSSGGSHGGGSHFGGSSSGGYRSRGPMIIHFGRTRYVVRMGASRCISLLVVLLCFALFGVFASAVIKSSSNSGLREIKQDYIYYQDMVSYAKQHTDRQIEGTVITKYYKENYDKWYITYYFTTDNNQRVEGYTFSVYTFDEVKDIRAGDKILLAVDGLPLTTDTDSIPMDYGDMPIEKDGEYQMFVSQKKGANIALIVCISIAAGCVVISIITAMLNKVKVQEHPSGESSSSNTSSTSTENENSTNNTPKPTYCQYCGAEMEHDSKKCSNCGAKQQK